MKKSIMLHNLLGTVKYWQTESHPSSFEQDVSLGLWSYKRLSNIVSFQEKLFATVLILFEFCTIALQTCDLKIFLSFFVLNALH